MPDYGWNGSRYFNLDNGQFVSSSTVRDALESVMEQSAINMNALSQQLVNGEISLSSWQTGMMQQVKLSHTAGAASANGGFAQMSQSDWGFAGSQIKKQYEYLGNFAGQIASGEQQLNGQVLVRADMYGQAARGTYEAQRQRLEVANGMEEERRILEGDGASCAGCLEQAGLGWQPIGTLDPIGAEQCLTNCRCGFDFRKSDEDEGVFNLTGENLPSANLAAQNKEAILQHIKEKKIPESKVVFKDADIVDKYRTFLGQYDPATGKIIIYPAGLNRSDAMETMIHELAHMQADKPQNYDRFKDSVFTKAWKKTTDFDDKPKYADMKTKGFVSDYASDMLKTFGKKDPDFVLNEIWAELSRLDHINQLNTASPFWQNYYKEMKKVVKK